MRSAPSCRTSIGIAPQHWLTSSARSVPCARHAAPSFGASSIEPSSNRTILTETRRVRGVSAAMKSSAVIQRPEDATSLRLIPYRASIGFHVVYCISSLPIEAISQRDQPGACTCRQGDLFRFSPDQISNRSPNAFGQIQFLLIGQGVRELFPFHGSLHSF